jgi:hypothetical protein
MLIVIDHRAPRQARERLGKLGSLQEIMTVGITYPAISGHPDIFLCHHSDTLVMSPDLFEIRQWQPAKNQLKIIPGSLPPGRVYPSSCRYDAVVTDNHIIHNFRFTDFVILDSFPGREHIQVSQGYTRCNLLALNDTHFITSDRGILKALAERNLEVLYVSPKGILLEGFPHGFFGGACGVLGETVYCCGSMDFFPEGEKVRSWLFRMGFNLRELNGGPLADIGGIFFL